VLAQPGATFAIGMNNKAVRASGVSKQVEELATISVEDLFSEAWDNERRFK
jgi:hypothetical protein